MNRECRNCAHAARDPSAYYAHCNKQDRFVNADGWCTHDFRPYTEKGEERDAFAFGTRNVKLSEVLAKTIDRVSALEEDEGAARAARLLHGGELIKAKDRIRALEDTVTSLVEDAATAGDNRLWIKAVHDDIANDLREVKERLDKLEESDIAIGSCRRNRDRGK